MDSWSDDTILPLVNFQLCSFPTSETGGITPFELKYGTKDAKYFKLPEGLHPGARCHELLKRLDSNIEIVREISTTLQKQIAIERGVAAAKLPRYEPGDFILWDPRETPCDHLETKLSPPWLGPYEVIEQVKNDIECVHLNLGTKSNFHVSRVKPFFGSRQDAVDMAKLDRNQFFIVSFNHFSGNPFMRQSMIFNVTFEDGTVDVPYSLDLANSAQFDEYVHSKKALLPLRYSTKKDATTAMGSLNKLAISDVSPGESVFLDLRFFDGATWGSTEPSMWFDNLNLPKTDRAYVFQAHCVKWSNSSRKKIVLHLPILQTRYVLNYCHVSMFVHPAADGVVLVDAALLDLYPAIRTCVNA